MTPQAQLQSELTALAMMLLPVILAVLSQTLAGILQRDRLKFWQNEAIADSFVILAAIAEVLLSYQSVNDLAILIAPVGTAIILLARNTPSLNRWTGWLRSNVWTGNTPQSPTTPSSPTGTSTPSTPEIHINKQNTEPPPQHNNWTANGETEAMSLEEMQTQEYVEQQLTQGIQRMREQWTSGHRLHLPSRIAHNA